MAVDFGKLNKAGLGASTFGARKTTGTSAQAAKNLQSSSVATKSSLFSFKGSPRTNWVPGQHVSKGQHQYNYQGMRASLNGASGPRRSYAPQFSGPVGNYGMQNVKVNNDYAKGMVIGQTIVAGMSLLNQLGVFGGNDGVKSSSLGDKLGDALGNLGGGGGVTGSSISGSISAMDSASDSASLRTAILGAEGQLSSMNSMTQSLTDAAEVAKGQIDGLEADVDKGEKTVKSNNQKVSNAKNTVTARTNNRDNKQNALEKADANYGKAVDKYTKAHDAKIDAGIKYRAAVGAKVQAHDAYTSASAAYEATPATLPDGSTNPEKAKAKKAMDNAKAKLDEAIKQEAATKKALDDATTAETAAEKDKNQAYNNLTTNKEAVDLAEADLKNAQIQLDSSKEGLQFAKDDLAKSEDNLSIKKQELESANGKIETLKQHNEDVKTLSKSIEKAKTRLAKLEKEEQEDWTKHNDKAAKGIAKNNERSNGIVGDVDTAKERRLSRKMAKTNDEVDAHLEARNKNTNNVDLTFVMKQAPSFTDASGSYRTGTNPLTGNTVYAKDGQLISEEEYNAALKAGGANL